MTSHVQNFWPNYLLFNDELCTIFAVQIAGSLANISDKQFKFFRIRELLILCPFFDFSHGEEEPPPEGVGKLDVVAYDALVVHKQGGLELFRDLANVFRPQAC